MGQIDDGFHEKTFLRLTRGVGEEDENGSRVLFASAAAGSLFFTRQVSRLHF